jgi:hypothetical protein
MTEREVVLDRILGIEAAQRGRHLLRGPPGCVVARGEPEVLADPEDVRVDGHDQHRRIDGPEPEVDAVGAAHHPAQVEDEALARAARFRIGDEMPDAAPARRAAELGRERREPGL